MDINHVRKIAGLLESKDATPQHITKEKGIFSAVHKALEAVIHLAEDRLKDKMLTDEHKTQYTELLKDARGTRDVMKAHLATYK